MRRLRATDRADRGASHDGADPPARAAPARSWSRARSTTRRRGARRKFVAINCAAIPATLLESELFGHVRGAFTDAVARQARAVRGGGRRDAVPRRGRRAAAARCRRSCCARCRSGEIRRVGDTASIKVDVRLIAATLRDLEAEIAAGRFREDLYYRLNVVPVEVPPLRERARGHPAARRSSSRRATPSATAAPVELGRRGASQALAAQPWPGNVRELENVLERRARALRRARRSTSRFLGHRS